MFLCMFGFFVADLLMYRLHEGGRHTLVYIIGMIMLLPFFFEGRGENVLIGIIAGCFLVEFMGCGNVPYEFDIPYKTADYEMDLKQLSAQLSENMLLDESGISYANTVIWPLWDDINPDTDVEENEAIDFGAYFALPEGFGINLCDGGYVYVNLESMQSRYIGTIPGGSFEKRCIDAGGVLIGECGRLVIYDMKP